MKKKRRKSPRIQFRLSKNRKSDTVRFLLAGLFFFVMITIYWNRLSTPLGSLAQGYQGYILKGMYAQKILDEEGVALLKSWLEQKTSPTMNPVTILQQHRYSKKPTEHYDFAIGIQSLNEDAFREYGVYQAGHTIFLQVEPMGIDRVLTASFSPHDLEIALAPYIKGEFRSTYSANP